MRKILWILFVLILSSCARKFDSPPSEVFDEISSNTTIKALKQVHVANQFERIDSDQIVEGVVIANDASGNFYQNIIIQDSSGGIVIRLTKNSLYTEYPIGRKVYVKCKGLYLGDYGGTIQLGGGIDSSLSYRSQLAGIANGLIDNYIVKGNFNQVIKPISITVNQLTDNIYDSLQSRLVQINNVQFQDADLGKTLADATKQVSAVSFQLQSCNGSNMILRNSSYASFARTLVPNGNGNLVGIYTIYNGDKQIVIRDTSDLSFLNTRCSLQLADTNKLTTIKEVRKLFKGSSLQIPFSTVIKGTVISDSRNESYGNYKIQDESGRGIIVYGSALPVLEFAKTYLFDIGGATLETFSNELEITKLSTSKIFATSFLPVHPLNTNVKTIMDSLENYASTLVRLSNIYFSAPIVSNSGRTYTILDNTGTIETFIRSSAAITIQSGNATSLQGYLSLSQGRAQIILRNTDDVVYNGVLPSQPVSFNITYSFQNVTTSSGRVDPGPVPTTMGVVWGAFRSVGLGSNPSANGRFSFTGWPLGANSNNNDLIGSIDMDKYYEVSITPNTGAKLSLNAIDFVLQRSATGPRQWAIRSSIDQFSKNIAISSSNNNIRVTGDNYFQIAERTIVNASSGCRLDLNDAYKTLTSAITFRIYALNAESSQGSFSINSFRFEGQIE